MKRRRISWFLVGVVFVAGGALGATVEVDGGVVRGSATEDGIHIFLGVPYAAAPGGELR